MQPAPGRAPFMALLLPDLPLWAVRFLEPAARSQELLIHASGRIVACSEGPAGLGIRPGWSLERARSLDRSARPVQLRGPELGLAWEEALAWIHGQTPWIEAPRPGQATLHPPNPGFGARAAAHLGAHLGQASDRTSAWLAAAAAQAGRCLEIPPGQEERFRARLPVEALGRLGLGPATLERLRWLGLAQVGALARLTGPQLRAQFEEGGWLEALLRDRDPRPVALYQPPPSIQASHSFEEPAWEPGALEAGLEPLLEQAAAALAGRQASALTVTLEGPEGPWRARRILKTPTAELARLRQPARLALQGAHPQRPVAVERLALTLGGLAAPAPRQASLWARRPPAEEALRALEARFPGRLLRIARLDPWAALPEEAASYEPLGGSAGEAAPGREGWAR